MKRNLIIFIIVHAVTLAILSGQNQAIPAPADTFFTLNNGLKVYIKQRPQAPLVNVVLAIGLGSRDDQSQGGYVHLLEHLLLLGSSQSTSAAEFSTRLRASGIYTNAHTDHDLMTFELSATTRHMPAILALAKEKIFQLKINEAELEKEKKAVLLEIDQISDDPDKNGLGQVFKSLFANHPYSRPIFGEKAIIETAQVQDLGKLYEIFLVPNNMSMVIVGDVDLLAVQRMVGQNFGSLPAGAAVERTLPKVSKLTQTTELSMIMDVPDHHLFFGFLAPALNHPSRAVFNMIVQIFGEGINPLLRSALRGGGQILAKSVSVRYFPLEQSGAVVIHLRCDADKISRLKKETLSFLNQATAFPYAPKDLPVNQRQFAINYLENAYNNLNMIYQSFQEDGLAEASGYARSLMLMPASQSEDYLSRLSRIKTKDLTRLIEEFLAGQKHVLLTIKPLESK